MGSMTCPRCDNRISLTMGPSDHTGYFVSNRDLESLEAVAGREPDLYEWCAKNLREANHCPWCGHVWAFEDEMKPTPGYLLDSRPRQTWKPPPLLTLECRTEGCADKGGFIRRSQAEMEHSGVLVCDACGKPYVKKEV